MDLNTNLQPIRDWLKYDTVAYCDNVIYTNGRLTRILNDVGFQSCDSAGRYKYHYYLKDHEGNIRVVTDDEGNREQLDNKEERRVITGSETKTAISNKEGVRINHKGYLYETKSPITTEPK